MLNAIQQCYKFVQLLQKTRINSSSQRCKCDISYFSISSCYWCSLLIYFSWSARKHTLWTPWRLVCGGRRRRAHPGATPPARRSPLAARRPAPQWEMFQGLLSPYAPFCERHLQGYCVNRTLRYFLWNPPTEVDWKNKSFLVIFRPCLLLIVVHLLGDYLPFYLNIILDFRARSKWEFYFYCCR